MRSSAIVLFIALTFALSGCGENDAAKANKKVMNANSSDVNLKLAHASEDAGDFPAAEHLYRQAASKGGSIEAYMELSEFYDRHHGERQSLAALNEALKIDPSNTDLMRAAANAHIKLGEPQEALKMLDEALSIKSNDALLYNSKGVALDMLGRYVHARNAYSTALSLDPEDSMMVNANIGMSYIADGEYRKAINLLRPLADLDDTTPQIRQNLSLAYGLSGDNENAMKYAEKDISNKDAQENTRFYKLFTDKEIKSGKASGNVPDKVTSIPPIP